MNKVKIDSIEEVAYIDKVRLANLISEKKATIYSDSLILRAGNKKLFTLSEISYKDNTRLLIHYIFDLEEEEGRSIFYVKNIIETLVTIPEIDGRVGIIEALKMMNNIDIHDSIMDNCKVDIKVYVGDVEKVSRESDRGRFYG